VRLQVFVFCDCYEQGRLKCPPPNPKLVKPLANGDLTIRAKATPEQHADFVAWRTNACRHPEGVVFGGNLAFRLPLKQLHQALSPHRRAFPLLVGRILECKPCTGTSHLTLKQVGRLQAELARLKSFRFPEGKSSRVLDRNLRCLHRRVGELVRAAQKIAKPIAL
jgi:hypothetical protein